MTWQSPKTQTRLFRCARNDMEIRGLHGVTREVSLLNLDSRIKAPNIPLTTCDFWSIVFRKCCEEVEREPAYPWTDSLS